MQLVTLVQSFDPTHESALIKIIDLRIKIVWIVYTVLLSIQTNILL